MSDPYVEAWKLVKQVKEQLGIPQTKVREVKDD